MSFLIMMNSITKLSSLQRTLNIPTTFKQKLVTSFFSQGLLDLEFYFFGSTRHEHEQTRNSSTLTIPSGK